jgi:hypothetical protein
MAKPHETNGKDPPPRRRHVRRHPDAKLLKVLSKHYDSDSELAAELGVKPQALNNWKRRGIAPALRGRIFKLATEHGCAPELKWLTG